MTRLRVLSLTTLLPNPARPGFGLFVASSLEAVAKRDDIALTVINPVGIPPWPLSRREPYATWAKAPAASTLGGAAVHHLRFLALPKFADGNPARIVAAVAPLVRRLHRETPFDVIDAQFFFPDGPVAAALARELNLPLSIKARGSDIYFWTTRQFARRQILAAADRADGLLAVSEVLASDMAALGMPAEQIAVHYTGLDHATFRPTPREEARAEVARLFSPALPAGPLYLSIGALIPKKGLRFAITALAQLERGTLALAGTGPDEAALRRLAGELGAIERVRFLGQVAHADLPMLLSAADALVHPSESEGIANVWIEALACGTPVVAAAAGGVREIIADPEAGRVVAHDADQIAAALREVAAQGAPQSAVAAHVEPFTWERNAAELAAHWRRLAGR